MKKYCKGIPLPIIKLKLSPKILLIMKVSLLLIIVSTLHVSANLFSQSARLSLNVKDSPLINVIKNIEQQSNYRFFFSDNYQELENLVSINIKDGDIRNVLDNLLEKKTITYKLLDNNIIVIAPIKAFQQQTITGKISDASTGEPIIGANIIVEGTTLGTVSDVNGKFSIEVSGDPVLIISYLGYVSRKVVVSGQNNYEITLVPDIKSLQEVVVIGYGVQNKKDLTGSVAVVKTNDLHSQPVPSVSDALQGRAAGVQVISSGTPGNDATFRIRGIGTINNANPLIVIDGLPVSGGLNQLNMDDIESLQVLKDASATAIYGSRGANGVVIVTTKHGKSGQSHLDFKYLYGLQQSTNMVKLLNAEQFATLNNEMLQNAGMLPNPAYADPAGLGTGTDWLGAMFRTAAMQNLSVSYSGSSEKTSYYVSGNYLKQDGIVINTGFKRYTFQLNTESKVFSKLKLGNNLTLNHDQKPRGDYSIRNAMLALPTQPVFREDGTYSGPVSQAIYDGDIVNPVGLSKTVNNNTKGYNLMGSVFGELEIIEGLKFKSTFGLQANLWDDRTWAPAYHWDTSINSDSYLRQEYNKAFTWLWDNILTYEKTVAKHRFSLMTGTSAQEYRRNYINGSIKGFTSEITQQLYNGTTQKNVGGSTESWALFSYMGRVNYTFADKYLITATLRRDGSSRFGENNRFGLFPSASVAWRISEEGFFRNQNAITAMKIRAGYGITGNQEIGNYSFASSLNTFYYNFNNNIVSAVVPAVMPNPNVQWERQKQSNIGFDASLLNQRIDLTFDAYLKQTDKMLVPMVVPVSTGYSDVNVPSINAGKMENRGIEITVNSRNLTGNFKWETNFNVSYNQNKVVSINDTVPMSTGSIGLNQNLALIQADYPVNFFYGFKTDGIFQTQTEVDNHAVQVPGNDPYNRTSAGDIRFKDLNNDGIINDMDRTYLGNPNPNFIFALGNTFSYQGLDLTIFIQGVSGNQICNANRFWSEAMAVAQNQTSETINRWTGEGTSNIVPRAIYNDPNKNTRPSDRYIEDGSYLRIKTVTLGYTLPNSLIERVHLSNARIYVAGQNLYTITKYKGSDPEVGINGIDNNVYPVTRIFSVGVNLGF